MHHMFGAFMPYQGGGYGVAVLMRLPVVEWWNHRLPGGDELRTSVTARVRLRSGRTLLVSGIHFYRTEPERLAQAARLLKRLANFVRVSSYRPSCSLMTPRLVQQTSSRG